MTAWNKVETFLGDAVGVVFPSAQLIVVDRNRIEIDLAVGSASRETLFDLASLTKPLCTALLTMLRPNGREIDLDDRVRDAITVRDLLSHSSGLPAWKLLGADPVAAVREEPLEYPTGTRSVYSDLGFILLGDYLERRTTRSLVELFDDCIARPLGVETTFQPDDPGRCAPCEGLRGIVHDENARAMGGVAGHAGLFSTARDVSRIVAAHFGDQLIPRAAVEKYWSPSGVPGSTWCLGWDRPSAQGSSAGTRWPRDGVGHLGYTGTSIWIDPPRARWVVLLTNRVEPTRENERIKQLRPALHDLVVEALDG
jgi:CubicO group peptidase (beta-lactamase class C family)